MAEKSTGGVEPREWLEGLFTKAFETGATDIFLSSVQGDGEELLRVEAKLRLNNEMVLQTPLEGKKSSEVIVMIKQRAEIKTSSLIEPAEGKYPHVRVSKAEDGSDESETLQIRITAYPTKGGRGGEFISMRIPPTGGIRELADLGFSGYNRSRLDKLIAKPQGLIVLAGPMGSGKTTTLYGCVQHVGGPSKSVITVEDPIERTLAGANQMQIAESSDGMGMTYTRVLKSLLRVVLDVLLIGEIRDEVTAEAAIRIATAGTRVFSSIHAEDPVMAIAKIISYSGQTPVNVLPGISGIVAQRMVRLTCQQCQTKGCERCNWSGFVGKAPIHEVLVNSPAITEAFVTGTWRQQDIRLLAIYEGMHTFHDDAERLVKAGLTTQQEVEATIGFDTRSQDAAALARRFQGGQVPAQVSQPPVQQQAPQQVQQRPQAQQLPGAPGVQPGQQVRQPAPIPHPAQQVAPQQAPQRGVPPIPQHGAQQQVPHAQQVAPQQAPPAPQVPQSPVVAGPQIIPAGKPRIAGR